MIQKIQMEKTGNGLSIAYCHSELVGDGIVELTFEKFEESYAVKVDFYPDLDSVATFMKIQHCLILIEDQRMSRAQAIKVLVDDPIVKAVLVEEMDW